MELRKYNASLRIYLGVFKHMEKDTVVYFCKLLMKLG